MVAARGAAPGKLSVWWLASQMNNSGSWHTALRVKRCSIVSCASQKAITHPTNGLILCQRVSVVVGFRFCAVGSCHSKLAACVTGGTRLPSCHLQKVSKHNIPPH